MTFNRRGAGVASLSMAGRLRAKPRVSHVKSEKRAGGASRWILYDEGALTGNRIREPDFRLFADIAALCYTHESGGIDSVSSRRVKIAADVVSDLLVDGVVTFDGRNGGIHSHLPVA